MANKKNYYFNQDTEDAIVAYNKSDDFDKRNAIYNEHIDYPFNKLAENVLNTFKFIYFDSEPQDVMKEVVSFLVLNIHKYQEGKGKAFSYFSVVAKNYLILKNNNNYKRYKKTELMSDMEGVWELPNDFYIEQRNRDMKEFTHEMLEFWEDNLRRIFKKDRDILIADSVLELFRRCENIENYNKKALYLLIREMTGCKTQHITKVINKMKTINNDLMFCFNDAGVLPSVEFTWPLKKLY